MAEAIYKHIGQKIRAFRERSGMSQEDLGQVIGVTANTVSRWETATYKPSVADLDSLARTFEAPIWAFLPSDEQPPVEGQRALLSATGDLPEDDLEELQRYADFIRARKSLQRPRKQSARRKRST